VGSIAVQNTFLLVMDTCSSSFSFIYCWNNDGQSIRIFRNANG